MAQDREPDEEQPEESPVDASHDLDLVTLFRSLNIDGEMEADMVRGVLDSNGIPSLVVRAAEFPPLGYEVQVPRGHFEQARQLIAEAQAAGPEAAAEAEALSEEGQ